MFSVAAIGGNGEHKKSIHAVSRSVDKSVDTEFFVDTVNPTYCADYRHKPQYIVLFSS